MKTHKMKEEGKTPAKGSGRPAEGSGAKRFEFAGGYAVSVRKTRIGGKKMAWLKLYAEGINAPIWTLCEPLYAPDLMARDMFNKYKRIAHGNVN